MDSGVVTSSPNVLADLATPEVCRDPYPLLRWLRENEPVHRTSAGFYLVSRHCDAQWALRNSGDLLRGPDRDRLAEQFAWALSHRSMEFRLDHVLMKDPPEHTRLRRLVAQDFTPRRVSGLSARIEHIADGLLAAIAEPLGDGETVDLHHTLAKPLSLQVISELLGVPEADRGWLGEAVIDFVSALGSLDEASLTITDGHIARLEEYFRAAIDERRGTGGDDLISSLTRIHDQDEDRLRDPELIAMILILWIAGFETTAASIDHGALAMFAHPDQWHWLADGSDAARAFADEVLRHTGPAIFTPVPRFLTREVELSGVTLPAGADVRPVFAAANRDPEVFPDPDRFDPARDTSASLSFSHGIHHCLGAPLARLEMTVALSRLHAMFPGLAPGGDPVWGTALPMHAPVSVPVTLA
ncbi:cytochrome P450 [Lentzea sp. NPDC051838]|uniref:cytochrome P450 n=1 Tax=Lentzea sp. NPDC051838 TaxID=3154849 RepID=UPI003433938E